MSSGVALWLIVIYIINAINENLDVVTHTHILDTLTPSSKIDFRFHPTLEAAIIYQHRTKFHTSIESATCENPCRCKMNASTFILPKDIYQFSQFLQILAAAILDHHYLSAQNKMQCFHCILHMRNPRHRYQKYASTNFLSSNCSDAHLGFMQIRNGPQCCHSGKRWILAIQIHQKSLQTKHFWVH